MSKEHNDNLEQFFRKATSHYETEFNEEDWRKMEKMLDENEAAAPVKGSGRARLWRSVGGVVTSLAIIVTAYFLFTEASTSPENVAHGSDDKVEDSYNDHDTSSPRSTPQQSTEEHLKGAVESDPTATASNSLTPAQGDALQKQYTADNTSVITLEKDKATAAQEIATQQKKPNVQEQKIASVQGDVQTGQDPAGPLKTRHAAQLEPGKDVVKPEDKITGNTNTKSTIGTDQPAGTLKPGSAKKNEGSVTEAGSNGAATVASSKESDNRMATSSLSPQTTSPNTDPPAGALEPGRVEKNESRVKDASIKNAATFSSSKEPDDRVETATSLSKETSSKTDQKVQSQAQKNDGAIGETTIEKGALMRTENKEDKTASIIAQNESAQRTAPVATREDEKQFKNITRTGTSNGVSGDSALQVAPELAPVPESGEQVATQEDRDEKSKDRLVSRWNILFVVAPDFSKTSLSSYANPGDAFGLLVNYRVLDRWSISTGALYGSKKYWGFGSEYHPPHGYWNSRTKGVVPEKVSGHCAVMEVPLSIAYDILQRPRSRLYVSGGVSSYFMFSERYWYTFENPDPGMASGWSTDKSSKYVFNIGAVSLGYAYQIRRNISLGLEPYYKIPFSSIGWANINLYSTGVYFSAQYRFLKKERA